MDPNGWSKDGATALGEWAPSEDGKKLVYAIQDGGTDWRTVKVLDVDTGKVLDDDVEWVKFSGLAWAKDGSGFYYSRFAAPPEGKKFQSTNENQTVYFHKLGTPQSADRLIYATPDQQDQPKPGQNRAIAVLLDAGTELPAHANRTQRQSHHRERAGALRLALFISEAARPRPRPPPPPPPKRRPFQAGRGDCGGRPEDGRHRRTVTPAGDRRSGRSPRGRCRHDGGDVRRYAGGHPAGDRRGDGHRADDRRADDHPGGDHLAGGRPEYWRRAACWTVAGRPRRSAGVRGRSPAAVRPVFDDRQRTVAEGRRGGPPRWPRFWRAGAHRAGP